MQVNSAGAFIAGQQCGGLCCRSIMARPLLLVNHPRMPSDCGTFGDENRRIFDFFVVIFSFARRRVVGPAAERRASPPRRRPDSALRPAGAPRRLGQAGPAPPDPSRRGPTRSCLRTPALNADLLLVRLTPSTREASGRAAAAQICARSGPICGILQCPLAE